MTSRFNKKFIKGMITGAVLALVLIALGVHLFFTMRTGNKELLLSAPQYPEQSKLTIYGQADQDWPIRDLDGKEITLSEFSGKVVFLNRWATWCKPCLAEMPNIQKLYDAMKDEEVAFLLVSDEEEAVVRNFVEKEKYSLPFYLSDRNFPDIFISKGIPLTMIIDSEGNIVFKHVGPAKWDDKASRRFIRGLM